jgi:putative nucleotidyltransferase with HDIG domain
MDFERRLEEFLAQRKEEVQKEKEQVDQELKEKYQEIISEYERKLELLKQEATLKIIAQFEKELELKQEALDKEGFRLDDPIFDLGIEISNKLNFNDEEKAELLSYILEKYDRYTAVEHCRAMGEYAVKLVQELGYPLVDIGSPKEQEKAIRIGALIHNIGKLCVPREIVNKPGRLVESEKKVIEEHPNLGLEVAKRFNLPSQIIKMIYYHQESYD